MEKSKSTRRVKRSKHTPLTETEVPAVAPIELTQPETAPQPPQQNQEEHRPSFTADNSTLYRELLLERPATPTVTNIQEAVAFVEVYGRWSKKVQVAFR